MKCEICHLNKAVKSITRNIDGRHKELFVCDSCARFSVNPNTRPVSSPSSLTDILFSIGLSPTGEVDLNIDDGICHVCGMSRNEVRQGRRLGCPKCYDIFTADIRTFLSEVQSVISLHTGHTPNKDILASEIENLNAELGKAIKEERFEDAIRIRDNLKGLEKKLKRKEDEKA